MARLYFVLLVVSAALAGVGGAPPSPTDDFKSPCPFLTDPSPAISPISPASPPPPSPPPPSPPLFPPPTNAGSCSWVCNSPPSQTNNVSSSNSPGSPTTVLPPDTSGFELWSSPATWPSGIVPGLPGISDWANATVPCGRLVLLDVPAVNLALLQIKGFLKVLDHPSLPTILVQAHFIIVEGQLLVGTPAQHFRQRITFELTPNRNSRANFGFTSFLPAEPLYPRNLGHKVFAVVGGQVRLYGLPGPPSLPVWGQLQRSTLAGDTSISVDTAGAASWPVGGRIVIASTDYDRRQAEARTITGVLHNGTGAVISLDSPLQYTHYGQPNSLPNGMGGFVDQRAEVALLSRNIVITGTDEPDPYQYEGGHFIVFMTSTPQYIEGVEFLRLGQQGSLGRYSIHFHVVGSVPDTVCRKNSIHHSKQRCIVIHASHNITVDSNVAYNTSGHCFMTEEGGEVGNTFIRNIGILTNKVDRKIMLAGTNPPTSEETDDQPSTFWITNPRNHVINNVAAGSASNGYWLELRFTVRGMSLNIPGMNSTVPITQSLATFSGNVAHSNGDAGIRFYPNGLRPRGENREPIPGYADRLTLYKNNYVGFFIHATDYLEISNCNFADNGWGIYLSQDQSITLKDSSITALTDNFGNPEQCWRGDVMAPCRPVSGCTMPLQWGVRGRSTGGFAQTAPTFGLLIDQSRTIDGFIIPNTIKNVTFSNYDKTCRFASAIALVDGSEFWNPGHSVSNIKFSSNTNPIWLPPQLHQYFPWNSTDDGGEQSQFLTLWDKDGSFTGTPGYLVANNSKILPPGGPSCQFNSTWNAYFCPGTCYRSIQISYSEPGFTSTSNNVNFVRGDFSYIQITRISDGQVISLDGNLKRVKERAPVLRHFYAVLLANQTYQVTIVPSPKAPSFTPTGITVRYRGVSLCGAGLTLRFQPQTTQSWIAPNSGSVIFRQCGGATPLVNATFNLLYSYGCSGTNQLPWLDLALGSVWNGTTTIVPSNNPAACSGDTSCGLLWSGASDWLYLDDGREVGPDFYNPIANTTGWKTGVAPIGFTTWGSDYIVTTVSQPSVNIVTYLYRRSFSIKDSLCYSSINIEVIVQDGIVVYLNNQEIIRAGMPQTTITNSTVASAITPAFTWTTFKINLSGTDNKYSLLEGRNVIAIEQHVFATWAWQLGMDMRISAVRKNESCSGAVKLPEICDGLDNNFNGQIDEGEDGTPLKMVCGNACGNGTATCIGGKYVCNLRSPSPEICNGVDDNCDGAVDNGNQQLNCGTDQVCFRGKCLPMGNTTQSVPIWSRNSTRWSYYSKGGNLDEINPLWRNGSGVSEWSMGQAPLGFNGYVPTWDWAKTTINNFGNDGISMTAYFVKQFNLTQSEVNDTFSLDFNVRRVDGAVIYLNGVELFRTNMPDGPILYTTRAASNTQGQESSPGSNCCNLQWIYYPCTSCFRNSSLPLKAGANWIAAEVHLAWRWENHFAFDMDLFRNVKQPCTSGECVRKVTQTLISTNDVWQYLDGSLPLPPSNWMQPNFNTTDWKTGISPLGVGPSWLLRTNANWGGNVTYPRPTFYFRKVIQIPDANCLFQIDSSLLSNDGAAVYINGMEVFRYSLSDGPLTSDSFAFYGGDWQYRSFVRSGGWLNVGANVIAVELHRAESSKQNMFFDLRMTGSREALTCFPLPI